MGAGLTTPPELPLGDMIYQLLNTSLKHPSVYIMPSYASPLQIENQICWCCFELFRSGL